MSSSKELTKQEAQLAKLEALRQQNARAVELKQQMAEKLLLTQNRGLVNQTQANLLSTLTAQLSNANKKAAELDAQNAQLTASLESRNRELQHVQGIAAQNETSLQTLTQQMQELQTNAASQRAVSESEKARHKELIQTLSTQLCSVATSSGMSTNVEAVKSQISDTSSAGTFLQNVQEQVQTHAQNTANYQKSIARIASLAKITPDEAGKFMSGQGGQDPFAAIQTQLQTSSHRIKQLTQEKTASDQEFRAQLKAAELKCEQLTAQNTALNEANSNYQEQVKTLQEANAELTQDNNFYQEQVRLLEETNKNYADIEQMAAQAYTSNKSSENESSENEPFGNEITQLEHAAECLTPKSKERYLADILKLRQSTQNNGMGR